MIDELAGAGDIRHFRLLLERVQAGYQPCQINNVNTGHFRYRNNCNVVVTQLSLALD